MNRKKLAVLPSDCNCLSFSFLLASNSLHIEEHNKGETHITNFN